MTHRHYLALACLVFSCIQCSVSADEPNTVIGASFWVHNVYGTSHAQHQDVPFLCLWDTYCQRHAEGHKDICRHQYLVDTVRGHCRSFSMHGMRFCGGGHCDGQAAMLAPAPVQNARPRQNAAPSAENALPSNRGPQPTIDATVDHIEAPAPPTVDNHVPRLERASPPQQLPANLIPQASSRAAVTKLPNWVSWLTD